MSIKVSPLSCLRLQLPSTAFNWQHKNPRQASTVVCFLLIKSTPQHTMEQQLQMDKARGRAGEQGEGEDLLASPKRIPQSMSLSLSRFLHLPQTFFFCDFNLKFAQRSPGMYRNAEEEGEGGRRRGRKKSAHYECTVSAECMQTNSAMNSHASNPLIDSTDNGHIRFSLQRRGELGAGSELCSKLLAVLSVFT